MKQRVLRWVGNGPSFSTWLALGPAVLFWVALPSVLAQAPPAIIFHKNFEAGSLGKTEQIGENHFRCHVEGQCDEHGRNRQANWYYFQLRNVQGRDMRITLTDFVGEYNGRPGACPMTAETIPVFSYDNVAWQHFPTMDWDAQKKEATLRFTPEKESIWIAHLAPYPHSRILSLLSELGQIACVRNEIVGKTVQGRDLHLVTITDFEQPDAEKRIVWLIARQHAWETGTSYVMEGALRFISSDDPAARELRKKTIFKFTPTMDPDGCATGMVRFNANGYDLNRHWDEVDLRRKELLEAMPEIWYVKKAIFALLGSGRQIDLLLNLHNDETPEYMETGVKDERSRDTVRRLFTKLSAESTFDPTAELRISDEPDHTTNSLARERGIPAALMEQRISPSRKLSHQATVKDRLSFGASLVRIMAETVL